MECNTSSTIGTLEHIKCKGENKNSLNFHNLDMLYGTLIFMYLRPSSSYALDTDKMASVFYTLVIPALNPLIYSLRNKEVKEALRRTWSRCCGPRRRHQWKGCRLALGLTLEGWGGLFPAPGTGWVSLVLVWGGRKGKNWGLQTADRNLRYSRPSQNQDQVNLLLSLP